MHKLLKNTKFKLLYEDLISKKEKTSLKHLLLSYNGTLLKFLSYQQLLSNKTEVIYFLKNIYNQNTERRCIYDYLTWL